MNRTNNSNVYFFEEILRYLIICIAKGSDYARGKKSPLLDSGGYHGWY